MIELDLKILKSNESSSQNRKNRKRSTPHQALYNCYRMNPISDDKISTVPCIDPKYLLLTQKVDLIMHDSDERIMTVCDSI